MKNENIAKNVEAKKPQVKQGKPNIFVRMGRKLKEVFSEIKKVSWPSFDKVVKQTGVVVGVVLAFFIVIMLMDLGLGQLLTLLTKIGA